MKKIVELAWPGLYELTNQIYNSISGDKSEFGPVDRRPKLGDPEGAYTFQQVVHQSEEAVVRAKKIFPFIEPTLVFFDLKEHDFLTPHLDGTTEWGYPYNLVVPITDFSNTKTVYYENKDLEYRPEWKTTFSSHWRNVEKLTPIFEYTFNCPTLFFNQQLHSLFNNGDFPIKVGTWKISKNVTPEEILAWAVNNGIPYKEIY